MTPYKNPRLKPLKSFWDLTDDERKTFVQSVYDDNPGKEKQIDSFTSRDWEDMYRKRQFAELPLAASTNPYERKQIIESYTPEQRNKIYTDYVVNNAINDQFAAYPDELRKIRSSGLSTNGLIDLLESNYFPNEVIRVFYNEREETWKQHDFYESAIKESDHFIKHHQDDPLQLLGYAAKFANWLVGTAQDIVTTPLSMGNAAGESEAIDKNEAIFNNIVKKDIQDFLNEISTTGYPKAIQDNVWEVYNNAQSEGKDGRQALIDWFDKLAGDNAYMDEEGRHIYKNDNGEFVYTNYEGQEVLAPEYIDMTDVEAEEYQKLLKEGKTDPEDGVYQDENGWHRKIRRFEDSGNGVFHIFKDRKQFDENHASPEQLVQWITDFVTLDTFKGRSAALQNSSIDVQKHIGENQFKLYTDMAQTYSRFVGGLGNTLVVPIENLIIESKYGEEGLSNVLAGLNPDGSKKDHYNLSDPYYWSMVETAGSTAINTVNDYIDYGYSPYQSIYDPTKSEWGVRRTMSDAFPMIGYAADQAVLSYGLGAITKGLARGTRAIGAKQATKTFKNTGSAAARRTAYGKANKIASGIEKSQMVTVPVINSLGIAQGYASEAFKNVYEQGLRQIEALKQDDGLAYVQSLVGTEAYNQAVEKEFRQIYKGYNEAQKKEYNTVTNDDGTTSMVNPEQYARRQAEMKVRNSLLHHYLNTPEIQRQHNGVSYDEMTEQLKSDALTAYKTDYLIEAASQSLNFAMFRIYLMSPAQRALFNSKPLPMQFTEGGRKAAVDASRKTIMKEWGKGVGKTVFGGTLSNYNDEIRRDWAQAFGYSGFNDYMGYVTNPDNFTDQEAFHKNFWKAVYYANDVAGETAAKESSIRAGIVGGVGSLFGGGLNIGGSAKMIFGKNRTVSRQQLIANKEALEKNELEKIRTGWNTDEHGTRLSGISLFMEAAANVVKSPIFVEYQNVQKRKKLTQRLANSYNKFVEQHGDKIVDMMNLLETTVRAYNMSLNGRGQYLHNMKGDENDVRPISLTGAMMDNDALTAFEIIRRLNEYGEDKHFMGSDYLRRAYASMQEILNGDRISDNLIDEFLQDRENMTLADRQGMSQEERRNWARDILADRIKDMKKVSDAYNKSVQELAGSPFFFENDKTALNQILYMSVMQDRWDDRLKKINKEIGRENNHSSFYYGNRSNYEVIKDAQARTVNDIKGRISDVDKAIAAAQIKGDKRSLTIAQINKDLLSRHLTLEQQKLKQMEEDNVWTDGVGKDRVIPVLSEDEILNLNPTERAYMLDSKNYDEFSEEQQKVIDILKVRLTDYTGSNQIAMDKINDAKTLSERMVLNDFSIAQATRFPTTFINLTEYTKGAYAMNLANAYIDKEVENLFSEIENTDDINEKMQLIKNSYMSSDLLRDVVEMIPYYSDDRAVLDGVVRERQLEEDAIGVLDEYSADNRTKDAVRNLLYYATKESFNERDAMGQLELLYNEASESPKRMYEIPDTNGETLYMMEGSELAVHLNNLLSGLERLDYTRNSTVVYNERRRQHLTELMQERRIATEKAREEAERIEAERLKAEAKRHIREQEILAEREKKIKAVSKRNYADSREKLIEPKTKEEYNKAKKEARELSKRLLADILDGKTTKPLKRAIANGTANITGIIEAIHRYRNAEKLYGYLWDKSNNRTVAAIENALAEQGYTWNSIEGEVIESDVEKELIINETRHDENVLGGVHIAENSTPYIYKDGILLSKPRTNIVVGTKEILEEDLMPRKEWRRRRTGFRQFERELVEVPYVPYTKKKFQTGNRLSAKQRLFRKLDDLGLDVSDHETIILKAIANGQKFKWEGDDTTKGIGPHLTRSNSTGEKRVYRSLIDEENGTTPEEFVEQLNADLTEGFSEITLDEVLDVLRDASSASKAIGILQDKINKYVTEEERRAEELRQHEIEMQQDAIARNYRFSSMQEMQDAIAIEAEVLQKEAEEKYTDEEEAEEIASILDMEERKSMEEEAARHQEELENEIQEWKEGISDIYYNTEIEENYGTEETNAQPTGEESEGTEGTESGSPEVLQGEESTNREGLEGIQPLQAGSESTTVNGESQVRTRGTVAVTEGPVEKLNSEKTPEEFVADKHLQNPSADIIVIKTSEFPITIEEMPDKKDRLYGNKMYLFDKQALENEGIYDTTLPEKAVARKKLQEFLNDRKIRLQDIIDFELGKILESYPNVHIQFMKQKGSNNIYNVIEYTDGIAKLHNNDFGGVIESGGKKWLMIGVLGYSMKNTYSTPTQIALSNAQFSHFDLINRSINDAMASSNEEFFVHPAIYSKALEQSNGYVVNRTSSEEAVERHSIKSLLESKESNPHELTFETLKFGIQKNDAFIVYNLNDGLFFPIKEKSKNGSSYVLVPAANGNYVPMYIQPTYYKTLQNGRLKNVIDNLLNDLTNPMLASDIPSAIRLQRELEEYIAFGSDEKGVRLAIHSDGRIQIKVDGVEIASSVFGNIDAQFLDTLKKQNLRINVDDGAFTSPSKFNMYSEAGAMDVTSTILGLRGSMYTVSPVTNEGKPAITTRIKSGVLRENAKQLPVGNTRKVAGYAYYGNMPYHRLASTPDIWRSQDGMEVTDKELLEKLHYAEFIGEHRGNPNYHTVNPRNKHQVQYFIYNDAEKSGLRYDVQTDTFEFMTPDQYDKMKEAIAKKEREDAAKAELGKVEWAVAWEDTSTPVTSTTTPAVSNPTELKEEKPAIPQKPKIVSTDTRNLQDFQNSGTFAIDDILKGKAGNNIKNAVFQTLIGFAGRKGMKKPTVSQILKALEESGVSLSEQKNVQDWIDNINNCK